MHHKNPNNGIFEFKLFSFDSHGIAVDATQSLFADSESFQVAIATVFSILMILDIIGLVSLRGSSLGGGGREGERGESLQRCLRNFHFCVEFLDAKC